MDSPDSEKLVALIESLAAGTLAPAEGAELDEILSGDLSARRTYLKRMFMIADLRCRSNPRVHRLRGVADSASAADQAGKGDKQPAAAPADAPIPVFDLSQYIEPNTPFVLSSKSRLGNRTSSRAEGPLGTLLAAASALWQAAAKPRAIAAVVGGVILAVAATVYFNQSSSPVLAAHIDQAAKAVWNSAGIAPREGDALMTGQTLDLAEGEITLKFASGATTVVHGPAKIEFVAANAAKLDAGALLADVPPAAVGFSVETPTARIVDLGTRFTLAVNPQRTTEVQVTQGKVEAARRIADGSFSEPLLVSAGQAVQVDSNGVLKSIAFDPAAARRFETPTFTVIAHYRLGEDDKPADPSTTWPAAGDMPLRKAGSINYVTGDRGARHGVSFSGKAEDVLAADGALPTDLDNWVLEAWVRPHSLKNGFIVQNGAPGAESCGLAIRAGRWACNFRNRGTHVPQPLPELDQWMHVALVHQHGKHWFWVDGIALIEISDPAALEPRGVFAIGGYPAFPAETFDGDISDVRFSRLDGPFDPAMFLNRDETQ